MRLFSKVGALPNLLVVFFSGLEAKKKEASLAVAASPLVRYNRIFLSFAKILLVASLTYFLQNSDENS